MRRRRRSFAGGFLPTNLSNLDAWYKADVGVDFDGSNDVSQWDDQSGNGLHQIQATGLNQPTYVASDLNGLPGIKFDGADHFTKALTADFGSTSGSVFYVLSAVNPGAGLGVILSSCDEGSTPRFFALGLRDSSGDKLELQQRNNDTADTLRSTSSLTGSNQAMWRSDGSTTDIRIDNVDDTVVVVAGANNGDWLEDTTLKDNLAIGALVRSSVGNYGNFTLNEKITYGDSKSADDATLVSDYLANKWGL